MVSPSHVPLSSQGLLTAMGCRIGFVGTRFCRHGRRFAGERDKWAQVLWDHRHVSYWYAGKLDRDPEVSMAVPHAYLSIRTSSGLTIACGERRRGSGGDAADLFDQ